jgi:hypothetical protein
MRRWPPPALRATRAFPATSRLRRCRRRSTRSSPSPTSALRPGGRIGSRSPRTALDVAGAEPNAAAIESATRLRWGTVAPATWNRHAATVRSFVGYAARRGLLPELRVELDRRREPADRTRALRSAALESGSSTAATTHCATRRCGGCSTRPPPEQAKCSRSTSTTSTCPTGAPRSAARAARPTTCTGRPAPGTCSHASSRAARRARCSSPLDVHHRAGRPPSSILPAHRPCAAVLPTRPGARRRCVQWMDAAPAASLSHHPSRRRERHPAATSAPPREWVCGLAHGGYGAPRFRSCCVRCDRGVLAGGAHRRSPRLLRSRSGSLVAPVRGPGPSPGRLPAPRRRRRRARSRNRPRRGSPERRCGTTRPAPGSSPAMTVQSLAKSVNCGAPLPCIAPGAVHQYEWRPLACPVVRDVQAGCSNASRAHRCSDHLTGRAAWLLC